MIFHAAALNVFDRCNWHCVHARVQPQQQRSDTRQADVPVGLRIMHNNIADKRTPFVPSLTTPLPQTLPDLTATEAVVAAAAAAAHTVLHYFLLPHPKCSLDLTHSCRRRDQGAAGRALPSASWDTIDSHLHAAVGLPAPPATMCVCSCSSYTGAEGTARVGRRASAAASGSASVTGAAAGGPSVQELGCQLR